MRRRGGALLAVMWLSAALTAIAFSVANTVRAETERTSTLRDSIRSYYLATGALERALFYIKIGPGPRNPDNTARYFDPNTARMNFQFPSGVASVEIIPESSKLNINESPPPELRRLLVNLGVQPMQAHEITTAIVDWRTGSPTSMSEFDQYYLSLNPSFRARHASIEEIEELLLVKGMTPELFYGSYTHDAQGQLHPVAGLKDCVSVYGSASGAVDINTAEPAVLVTVGLSPDVATAIVRRRLAAPFRAQHEIDNFAQGAGPGFGRLTLGGTGTIYTLRSTGRLRLPGGQFSDMSRTVSALLKFRRDAHIPPIETLRWYDN
jgi:general secretion pathway protein K